MKCAHCGHEFEALRGKCGGRPGRYCRVRCRVAAMRERKRRAGLMPRVPWTAEGQASYYARQEARNRYPNPNPNRNAGPESFRARYAAYMAQWHPEESPELDKNRNPGPEYTAEAVTARARANHSLLATGVGNVTHSGHNVTPAAGVRNVTRARNLQLS